MEDFAFAALKQPCPMHVHTHTHIYAASTNTSHIETPVFTKYEIFAVRIYVYVIKTTIQYDRINFVQRCMNDITFSLRTNGFIYQKNKYKNKYHFHQHHLLSVESNSAI